MGALVLDSRGKAFVEVDAMTRGVSPGYRLPSLKLYARKDVQRFRAVAHELLDPEVGR